MCKKTKKKVKEAEADRCHMVAMVGQDLKDNGQAPRSELLLLFRGATH